MGEAIYQAFVTMGWWELCVTICNLLIMFVILRKFLFGPINKMLESRENEVREMYATAEADRAAAETMKRDYTASIANAKEEAAQIKAMKKVSGTLKLAYSQYRELQAFSQFGSDLDADTKSRLEQGERIVEVFKQPQNSPIPVEKQVVIIYAVVNKMLMGVPVEKIGQFQDRLFEYLETNHSEILDSIRETKTIDAVGESLPAAIEAFKSGFLSEL